MAMSQGYSRGSPEVEVEVRHVQEAEGHGADEGHIMQHRGKRHPYHCRHMKGVESHHHCWGEVQLRNHSQIACRKQIRSHYHVADHLQQKSCRGQNAAAYT